MARVQSGLGMKEFHIAFLRGNAIVEVKHLWALADTPMPSLWMDGTLLGRKGRCVGFVGDDEILWELGEEEMAMTPLVKIWWLGNAVYTMDAVGGLREICMCVSAQDREWVVWSLATAHKVPSGELRIPVAESEEPRHAAERWCEQGPASAFERETP